MNPFDKYNLSWWIKEDLEEMLEDYPNLTEMSIIELHKLKTTLYWEAQDYIETANRIENKANVIDHLIQAIEDIGQN